MKSSMKASTKGQKPETAEPVFQNNVGDQDDNTRNEMYKKMTQRLSFMDSNKMKFLEQLGTQNKDDIQKELEKLKGSLQVQGKDDSSNSDSSGSSDNDYQNTIKKIKKEYNVEDNNAKKTPLKTNDKNQKKPDPKAKVPQKATSPKPALAKPAITSKSPKIISKNLTAKSPQTQQKKPVSLSPPQTQPEKAKIEIPTKEEPKPVIEEKPYQPYQFTQVQEVEKTEEPKEEGIKKAQTDPEEEKLKQTNEWLRKQSNTIKKPVTSGPQLKSILKKPRGSKTNKRTSAVSASPQPKKIEPETQQVQQPQQKATEQQKQEQPIAQQQKKQISKSPQPQSMYQVRNRIYLIDQLQRSQELEKKKKEKLEQMKKEQQQKKDQQEKQELSFKPKIGATGKMKGKHSSVEQIKKKK